MRCELFTIMILTRLYPVVSSCLIKRYQVTLHFSYSIMPELTLVMQFVTIFGGFAKLFGPSQVILPEKKEA